MPSSAGSPAVPSVPLLDGAAIPQVGFGVYKVPPPETVAAVTAALAAGYRSLDTATLYGNEAEVGAAVRDSGLPREDVVVTTKLWNDRHGYDEALRAFDESTARLDLGVLDLYLIHWPVPRADRYVDTWRALVRLREEGRVRSIGVSNFTAAHLERVIGETGVVPVLNQVELHPYHAQPALRAFHAGHGIVTEAWAPLARGGRLLADPVVTAIAERLGRTPAQVVLRWHVQHGVVVIPKSVTPARIAANLDLFSFELPADDMAALDGLDDEARTGGHPDEVG